MISKIWLIQKSDGEFIDYVYTTKQLAECRTRHQQDGATLTIQEWVLADRPAPSDEAANILHEVCQILGVELGPGLARYAPLIERARLLVQRPEPSGEARCYRCDEPIASGEGVHLHDRCAAHYAAGWLATKASGRAKADARATFDALKKSREPHAPDMRTVDSEGFIESAPQVGEDTPIRVKREWGSRRVIKRAIDWFRAHPGESWENLPPATLSLYFWLNDVWSDGFEAAHALRKCGHSVGDYRDSNYIPGKPSTYKAQESCVGCADRDRARREALEEAAQYADDPLGKQHDSGIAAGIRALASAPSAKQGEQGCSPSYDLKRMASLSAEEIFIRTVIRLTCNDGCEHNEECEQDKIDDYVRTQLPRLLAAERDRARREALEEAANVRVPNTRFGGTNGLDVAEQEAIRALATRTGETERHE